MAIEHQTTREEQAYWRLLKEKEDMLSERVRTILSGAESTAYIAHMVHTYSFSPEEYEEAMEQMRLAAVNLTDREHELLAKIWRASLAAAASIDANDFESLAGYRVYSGNLHRHYRTQSNMIERTLQAKKAEEIRKEIAKRGSIDDWEIEF